MVFKILFRVHTTATPRRTTRMNISTASLMNDETYSTKRTSLTDNISEISADSFRKYNYIGGVVSSYRDNEA